jgi:hypothetical protein
MSLTDTNFLMNQLSNRLTKQMNIQVALLHYPVYNRQRQIIVSSVTNLDIHDIARAALTYGVSRFYMVTPLEDQLQLVHRLLAHWRQGYGAKRHPERKMALELVIPAASLAEVVDTVRNECGQKPELLITGASLSGATLSYSEARELVGRGRPLLILFGTGYGLADEVVKMADHRLAPIQGGSRYNHLSVRSAATAIFDRLLGSHNGNETS